MNYQNFTYKIVDSSIADDLVQDIVELYKAGGWWKESAQWRKVIPQMISGSSCFLVVENEQGNIIGMGRVISDGASDAYIQDVVVLNKWRGYGIGREIIKQLVEYCRKQKISWIGLVAEPDTYDFYLKLRFTEKKDYRFFLWEGEKN